MYKILLISTTTIILLLLLLFNRYRLKAYNTNDKNEISEIMHNIDIDNKDIKSQIQTNLEKLNKIDNNIEEESQYSTRFESMEDNILKKQFETNLEVPQIDNSKINKDVRSHFLYTDVSEENSLNIKKIENEIETLSDKIEILQNNLNSIQYNN